MRRDLLLAACLSLPFSAVSQTGQYDQSDRNDWTILFYGCADNDSEQSFCPDMEDARAGMDFGGGVGVYCLVDRSPDHSDSALGFGEDFHGTRLYEMTRDSAERLAGGDAWPEIVAEGDQELDLGDAKTLRSYLRWAKATHPARHYALIFYSHGSGPMWCPDETDGSHLFTAELTDTLEESDSLDLVVFDVCNMAGVENAYQWRPGTGAFSVGVMVGTPMAGFPFPWRDIFGRMRPGEGETRSRPWLSPGDLTPRAFGTLVIDETREQRVREMASGDHPEELVRMVQGEAMACLDLAAMGGVKRAVDALATTLGSREDGRDLVGRVRNGVEGGAIGYSPIYVDLYDFASHLRTAQPELGEAAEAVMRATDDLVVHSYGLDRYEGFEPGQHGVYIVLPTGPSRTGSVYDNWVWYRPGGADVGWGHGHYAWCADGATAGDGVVDNWFELIDRYFDESDEDGGRNRYRG